MQKGEGATALGRTVSALRKSIAKMSHLDPNLPALKNFSRNADAALKLRDADLTKMQEEEMTGLLQLIEIESAILPPHLQHDLTKRRVFEAMQKNDVTAVLELSSPWGSAEWDMWQPKCSSLSIPEPQKFDFFNSVVFAGMMRQFLEKGVAFSDEVLKLSSSMLAWLDQVDTATITINGASFLRDSKVVCRGLVGILGSKVDTEYLDPCVQRWDDVTELKEAMGSSKKSVVVNVASDLEKMSFYIQKMELYLSDVQGVLQYGSELEDGMDKMAAMTCEAISFVALQEKVENLHNMMSNVRESMMVQYKAELLKVSLGLASEAAETMDGALVSAAMKLLTELSIMYPLEDKIPPLRDALGAALAFSGQQATVKHISDVCQALGEKMKPDMSEEDRALVIQQFQEMSKISVTAPFPEKLLSPAFCQLVSTTKAHVVKFFIMNVTHDSCKLTVLGKSVSQQSAEMLDIMGAAFELHKAVVERKQILEGGGEINLELCFAERRLCLKLKHLLEKCTSTLAVQSKDVLLMLSKGYEDDLQKSTASKVDEAKEALTKLMQSCQDMIDKWDSFYKQKKSISESDLFELAKKTIMTVDPDAPEQHKATLDQACDHYNQLLQLHASKMQAALEEQVKAVAKKLKLLLVVGDFFNELSSSLEGEKKKATQARLFEPGQKMCKKMRADFDSKTAEQELLPAATYTKLQKVLAMK
eukprot:321465-Amphidinium_carterae.1